MEQTPSRDYSLDNIKCILIFCVVFCHLLEFIQLPGGDYLYRLVYIFHMPCFLFLNGYFVKEEPSTFRLCKQIVQYIIFQTLYLLFARYCMKEEVVFEYTRPYWIMWFSLASIFNPVFLGAFRLDAPKKRLAALFINFLVSILVGFEDSVGYYLSLSRLIVLYPFFLMGYCWRKDGSRHLQNHPRARRWFLVLALVGVAASFFFALNPDVALRTLRHTYSYRNGPCSMTHRISILLLAVAWIAFFMLVIRPVLPRKIPFISQIGANTLPIYLFHGFGMRILRYHHPHYLDRYWMLLLITVCCLIVLGNPILTRILDPKPPIRLFSCIIAKKLYNNSK